MDIEEIDFVKMYDEKVKLPSEQNTLAVEELIKQNNFDEFVDLFGNDFFDDVQNEEIDLLSYEPKLYQDFVFYKKKIIEFISNFPEQEKYLVSERLIEKVVQPFNSMEMENILQKIDEKIKK